ncbi:hypothetical protein ACWDSJ_14365 [Nocardia sp. NPDC003482]
MKSPEPHSTAEYRVMRKYAKLYGPLVELARAVQQLEPTGAAVDEVEFTPRNERGMRVAYKARPVRITICDGQQRFTLQLEDLAGVEKRN